MLIGLRDWFAYGKHSKHFISALKYLQKPGVDGIIVIGDIFMQILRCEAVMTTCVILTNKDVVHGDEERRQRLGFPPSCKF